MDSKIDQTVQWSLLLDFYGGLLTEHQREIFTRYHSYDLSLGEIAQEFQISRQGVYDILKRSERLLTDFESQLGLVARYLRQRETLGRIKSDLEAIAAATSSDLVREKVASIGAELEKL